ncbi:MAG: hypothetical protein HQL43_16340 [Alphaproteobacteria bacterium]|jgi:hypothetical protein|nr:hypothetical protein [Alphaproteobacteria bacterium]
MFPVDPSQNAKGRLLPPDVPFRFFGAAIFFHILAWLVLALLAKPSQGLTWPVLAALHLITLGVLAMVATGASFQLLPVATKRSVRSPNLCRSIFWMIAGGVLAFALGLLSELPWLVAIGGVSVALGLVVTAVLLADNLLGVDDMPVVTGHAWIATLSLVAVEALGGVLALNLVFGFLGARSPLVLAHGLLATFGFMGMLASGLSTILLPMFALSLAPSERLGRMALACNGTGLLLAVAGALVEQPYLMALGGALGLCGMGLLGWSLVQMFKKRMRKRTGFFFLPIWTGAALAPVSILSGLAALFDLFPNAGLLFIWLTVAGWLLTFLLGVLQRIMPFLASMHSATPFGRTPLLSQLMAEGLTKTHFVFHLIALVAVGAGLVLDSQILVRLGAVSGLLGALAFAGYGIELYRRLRRFKSESI